MVGRLFGVFTPNAILTSDSSQAAWGAHLSFILRPNESLETQGRWDQNQMSLHINAKELLAVHMALKVWHCQLTDHSVKMESDNRTTVALINNQGTVKSLLLHNLTCDLLTWCHTRRIRIRAVYLPGILNVLADELSRPDQILHTEWSLDQKVVDGLFQLWGKPHIDLFASKVNLKLPTYVSPTQDPQAFAVDALSIDWRRMYAYAFPPPNLLTKVVHKIQATLCQVILVTPYWPRMQWFAVVARLAVQPPKLIPTDPNPLCQRLGNGRLVKHRNPQSLRLHAWFLSSVP